jgi:hypothetical protein
VQLAPTVTVWFAGQLTVGAEQPACTVSVKVQAPVSPAPSVAVRVIVWLPTPSVLFMAGVWDLEGLAVQLSEAVAAGLKLASV